MKTEFANTPDEPPASAMDIIQNRKVTHAGGVELDEPFSMNDALASSQPEGTAPPTDDAEPPPEEPADDQVAAPEAEGADGDGEQQLPKSRFDQVNVRMHAAEESLAAEREATATLRRENAEMKREHALAALREGRDRPKGYDEMDADAQHIWVSERLREIHSEADAVLAATPEPKATPAAGTPQAKLREMEKQHGFTADQAILVNSVREQFKELTVQEATALAKVRQPALFSGNGTPQDVLAVPASHAAQPPQRTGTTRTKKQDPMEAARGMPQATGDQRDAKAAAVIKALRSQR